MHIQFRTTGSEKLISSLTLQSWPVRKENEMAIQQAEIRMVRWMCDVKVKDRVPNK